MKSQVTNLTLNVVGLRFRTSVSTRRMMQAHVEDETVEAVLVREPTNTHDPNAVKVILDTDPYHGFHIGYVDRVVAAALAPVLDVGVEVLAAVITDMDAEAATAQLEVSLKTPVQAKKKVIKKKSPKKG